MKVKSDVSSNLVHKGLYLRVVTTLSKLSKYGVTLLGCQH